MMEERQYFKNSQKGIFQNQRKIKLFRLKRSGHGQQNFKIHRHGRVTMRFQNIRDTGRPLKTFKEENNYRHVCQFPITKYHKLGGFKQKCSYHCFGGQKSEIKKLLALVPLGGSEGVSLGRLSPGSGGFRQSRPLIGLPSRSPPSHGLLLQLSLCPLLV